MTIDVLDNPIWHALEGPHRPHALGRGLARHYPRDIAPFSAIGEPSAAAYADLAADLPAGTEARLFRPQAEPLPDGWEETNRFALLQMVASRQLEQGGSPVAVLSHAERIEEEVLALQRQLDSHDQHLDGTLRVSSSDWFGIHMLTPVLTEFATLLRTRPIDHELWIVEAGRVRIHERKH